MTFRKFRKKYRVKAIEVCSDQTSKYEDGCAKGICINRIDGEEYKFNLFCKFSLDEINSEWKKGDKGQVKITEL